MKPESINSISFEFAETKHISMGLWFGIERQTGACSLTSVLFFLSLHCGLAAVCSGPAENQIGRFRRVAKKQCTNQCSSLGGTGEHALWMM